MSKALVGVSGGVDSSVAALLMRQAGCDVTTVNFNLIGDVFEHADLIVDLSEEFRREVIERFIDAYSRGLTPNPCVDCNRHIKFGWLHRQECLVATGHYARIKKIGDTYNLMKAVDETKDQSYFLYTLGQEGLANTKFPLGELRKAEVREIAQEHGFSNANKKDSQDICFLPNGKYAEFIGQYIECSAGDFVDLEGNILGEHKGAINYTIGQRKGIGLAFNKPMYVCKKCSESHTVTLSGESDLYSNELVAGDVNFISMSTFEGLVTAKIRYNQAPQAAFVHLIDENKMKVVFDEPQRAIAPGQAVVFYDGEVVLGGGTIMRQK